MRQDRICLTLLLLIGAGVFFSFIHWGLPSRAVDPFLFGDRTPWTGQEILNLLPEDFDPNRGADVDANPISRIDAPIRLNATDAQRAEIVRRYRLFSYQPDEVITFMALAQMRPREGRLDPKLYQYGGLWIYPVGAMLKLSSMLNLVKLESSQAYYLDHPEEFGKFYIVARAYVALWGLVGVWAIYWLARRMTSGVFTAFAATLCCIFMPAVVNMSHEAKPHLPAAVLTLLAVISAAKYIETGKSRWGILTGTLCGAAFAMVISGIMSFILIPAMALMVGNKCTMRIRTFLIALACAFAVYAITNPYVIIHLFGDRVILESNLRNSTAMYGWSIYGFIDAMQRLAQATGLPLLIMGVAMLGISIRIRSTAGRLLLIVSAPILIQFVGLAQDKPAEYARFALVPAIVIALGTITRLGRQDSRFLSRSLISVMCAFTVFFGAGYLRAFARDCGDVTLRLIAASRIDQFAQSGMKTLGLHAEPAPYSVPPVDLFQWELWLNAPADTELDLRTIDTDYGPSLKRTRNAQFWFRPAILHTPITWAAKPFRVEYRTPLPPTTQPE